LCAGSEEKMRRNKAALILLVVTCIFSTGLSKRPPDVDGLIRKLKTSKYAKDRGDAATALAKIRSTWGR